MLEGKNLILATRDFAVENRRKSWIYLLSTLMILLSSYAVGFMVTLPIIKVIIGILSGLVVVRMFVIYHDYLHNTILQNSIVARVIFYIFGLFILAPFSIWRRSHDYHHKHNSKLYTSSIGSFPIVTREKFLTAPKSERIIYLTVRHPLTIALGYITAFIYGMCIMSLTSSPRKHWDSALSLVFHFSFAVLVFTTFGWLTFLLNFLLPALISSGMGSYLFYAQHNFPGVEFKQKENWSYYEAAMRSSSFMKMSKVMHWFTANIGYHHIHHMNAKIPFYRLPETLKHFPEFQNPKTTTLLPWDVWACMKLKVWDPEKNRMLTMKEARA